MKGGGPEIRLVDVEKAFDAVRAVAKASITFWPGEIHAVVGENGAGKSTLLKLAAGVFAPSSGEVIVDGARLSPVTPTEAIRRGVGMVHQHFMLVDDFLAIENLILGCEPTSSFGRVDFDEARRRALALMKTSGLALDLDRRTDALTVGERQRLEILRVLYRGARALLLDEPTAVLTPRESRELYAVLRKLADDGATVVVVTHHLEEVIGHANRVTVMRRGRVVLESAKDATEQDLTRAIMGAEAPPAFSRPETSDIAPVVLSVSGLALEASGGKRLLDDLSFEVKAGEIVGIAGVDGNGQRELVRSLAGLESRCAGRITIAGRDLADLDVRARRSFLAVVHADRQRDGLLLEASAADNLVLGDIGTLPDEAAAVAGRMDRFHVEPREPASPAASFSGGNQQKLVVARALDRMAAVGDKGALVLAEPTRGVDVGAAAAIHAAIAEAASRGSAIVLVSADLGELRKLAHVLLVLHRGRIVARLAPSTSEETIGQYMLGLEAA